ncbi:hypothetical protein QUW13_02715 [Enterococcus hirae]|nr:hypothetical protein [Enterococcus hirae]
MRYLDEIVFIGAAEDDHYDPNLGEWVEGEPTRTKALVNVTDLGTNRSVEIFGDIKQGAKVIRLQPLFVLPKWDQIEYDGRTWELTTERVPAERHTLIVQEVVGDVEINRDQRNRKTPEKAES